MSSSLFFPALRILLIFGSTLCLLNPCLYCPISVSACSIPPSQGLPKSFLPRSLHVLSWQLSPLPSGLALFIVSERQSSGSPFLQTTTSSRQPMNPIWFSPCSDWCGTWRCAVIAARVHFGWWSMEDVRCGG